MPMFGFDEQYAYYGVTPVDNQFILEYLPNASGDAVRVYLYGLMQCYHPQGETSIAKMAMELGMTEETVLAAYRHWERRGLVRRIADNPPVYRYLSVQQVQFMGGGSAFQVDTAYAEFSEQVYKLFEGRRLHGGEVSRCYEWVEQMKLPAEAVLLIIEDVVKNRGKMVKMATIEKRVMEMMEEGVQSVEDVRVVLGQEAAVREGTRTVLSELGQRRFPSVPELNLYGKWTQEWGFTLADVLAACDKTTAGYQPTFAYLDGILGKRRGNASRLEEVLKAEDARVVPLKALLDVLHQPNVTVNEETLALYEEMRTLYPDPIILMAGRECARHGSPFKDVLPTLKHWKRNRLANVEDVRAYMQRVDDQNDILNMLYEVMGAVKRPNAADRRVLAKWMDEFGYDVAFLTQCAGFAVGADKPMAYLTKMMEAFHQKKISTIQEAAKEREAFQANQSAAPARTGKTVGEQQYTQRKYTHTEDAMDALVMQWQEENGDA